MTAEPRDVEDWCGSPVAHEPHPGCSGWPSAEAREFIETAEILAEPYNEKIAALESRLAAADRENAELRGEVERLETDRAAQTQWSDDDGWLREQHARYHDQPGNLLDRTDCGYVRCDFWDAAVWVLNAPGGIRDARRNRDEAVLRRGERYDEAIGALESQLAAAQAQLAEASEKVLMRDKVIREWERVHWRDVDRMTAAIKAAEDVTRRIPSPFADNVARAVLTALSAAPQPEPEEGSR